MKKIIYMRPDGVLQVVTPTINTQTLVDGAVVSVPESISERQALERAIAKLPAYVGSAYQVVDESAIPTDRTFRKAWKAGAGCVDCDMTAAKGIARDMLRAERAERFKKLDGEWMRAMGRGDASASTIEAKREVLRNWPQDPRIGACATPAELKALVQALKAE